jgi:hypothetical protein
MGIFWANKKNKIKENRKEGKGELATVTQEKFVTIVTRVSVKD